MSTVANGRDSWTSERPRVGGQDVLVNDLSKHFTPHSAELSAALLMVLNSSWFVLGEEVCGFERVFAEFCGVDHAIGVGNGTDALELALKGVGVRPDDSVLTVANAGMYSTSAILAAGAIPQFVDVEPDSLLMDLDLLSAHLSVQRPGAVIATHLYGRALDMPRIVELAAAHEVPVVEDCAQAHGASVAGLSVGSFGAAAAFSFYPTKNLGAAGDGGAVVTNSEDVAAAVRQLRQYGWSSKYVSVLPGGRNSRLDEMQAAVLQTLLPYLSAWNDRRRAIEMRYWEELGALQSVTVRKPAAGDVSHLAVIRCRYRDSLRSHLNERGIRSEVHYPVPDHEQQSLRSQIAAAQVLPVTEAACTDVLTLPCYPELTDAEVTRVIEAVIAWDSAH